MLGIIKCVTWKLGHNNICKIKVSSNYEYTTTRLEPEKWTEKGRKICYYPTYPGDVPGGSDSIKGSSKSDGYENIKEPVRK